MAFNSWADYNRATGRIATADDEITRRHVTPNNQQLYAGGSQQFAQQNYGAPLLGTRSPGGYPAGNATQTLGQPTGPTYQPNPQPNPQPAGLIDSVAPQPINGVFRSVAPNETVQGQLKGIIDNGSPLLEQARARALEGMQERGMVNSAMAQSAGEDALYKSALQIATPDAATYGLASRDNQLTANETNRFNAQEGGLNYREGVKERGLDRRQGVTERGLGDRLNIEERGRNERTELTERGNTQRTQMNNDTQRYSTDVGASTSRYATDVGSDTQRYTAGLNAETQRYSTDVGASTQRYTADSNANTQRYTANLSAETQRDVAQYNNESLSVRDNNRIAHEAWQNDLTRINNINVNPDIPPEQRTEMVNNIVEGNRRATTITSAVQKIQLAVR